MKMRNDIELQMRRRDDAFTKAITNWLHSVGVRAEEIVEERGSHQAGGTHILTDRQAAGSLPGPGDLHRGLHWPFLPLIPSGQAGLEYTDRRLDSLGGEGRGREQ